MPDVDLLFGPMLIGVFLNTMLYGAMVVQVYLYFQTYKTDSTWLKLFVLYLLFTETLNTGFDIGMMYEPLIVRYATQRAIVVAPIMLSADPIMTVAISTPVQCFIAWRIRVISESRLVFAFIVFFSIASFIGGVATTVSVTIINEYTKFHQFDGAVITWLASSAAADIIITVSLVITLMRQKTGFSSTDGTINKIIRLTIQTGMITALSATADVTLFLADKKTTLNYIWDFALSKLYTNSLLSTLNARGGWNVGMISNARDNVLFGDASATACSTIQWRRSEFMSNLEASRIGEHEMEERPPPQKESRRVSFDSNSDFREYGMSVTKDEERMEDPLPLQTFVVQ